jgi:SAM-dependent methyltransferase
VVEIGCGQGEFISRLCALGGNQGTGFDPAWRQGSPPSPAGGALRFAADVFDARHGMLDCDFLCCNMTLEHIARPAEFLAEVRQALRPGTDVFFMVPDSRRILSECAFEDIYYEHCNYFTSASLAALFVDQGFDVLDNTTLYSGQYLGIHACVGAGKAAPPELADLDELRSWVDSFTSRWVDKRARWRRHFGAAATRNERIIIWGGGSKAVAFQATVPGSECFEQVVDINPLRQGHYLPDGQRIIAPADLTRSPPAEVVIMNSIYRDEIAVSLARLGLKPALSCL